MDGPQPIAIVDIMAYCAMAGVSDPVDRMTILHAVQALEDAYMAHVRKLQDQKRKNEEAKARRGRR